MTSITINQTINLVVSVPKHEIDNLIAAITNEQFVNFSHAPMKTAPMMEEFNIVTSVRHLPILLAAIESI